MDTKAGRLYVVGIGPGDPDLMSVRAARLLADARYVFVPLSQQGRPSVARTIISGCLSPQCTVEELKVPMVRDRAALERHYYDNFERIAAVVRAGSDAVLVTLGDPATYSTAWPIVKLFHERASDITCEIVPGITSYADAAARAAVPLAQGDATLSIVSAYDDEAHIEYVLAHADTVVFLKTYQARAKIIALLEKHGLTQRAVYVQRSGLDGQAVITDMTRLPGQPEYLSLLIVRTRDG